MNILFSTAQVIDLAVGETYTLKTDEVMINSQIYKKLSLEITMSDNSTTSTEENVAVGIRKREGGKSLPASLTSFSEWIIDGVVQTSLSQLVENINTAIQQ